MKKKISIIIPVFNELNRIPKTLEKIFQWIKNNKWKDISIDVNIVDDGSTDGTVVFIKKYKKFKINLLKKKHTGLMSTIIYGLNKIKSDFYIIIAADCPVDLKFLNNFFGYLQDYEIIQGSRYLKQKSIFPRHERPLSRVLLSVALSNLFIFFFSCKIRDPQIDFKIFSRAVVKNIIPNLISRHDGLKMTEIIIRAHAQNYKILEKKTTYNYIDSKRLVPNLNIKEFFKFIKIASTCFCAFINLIFIYRNEFKLKKIKKNPLRFL